MLRIDKNQFYRFRGRRNGAIENNQNKAIASTYYLLPIKSYDTRSVTNGFLDLENIENDTYICEAWFSASKKPFFPLSCRVITYLNFEQTSNEQTFGVVLELRSYHRSCPCCASGSAGFHQKSEEHSDRHLQCGHRIVPERRNDDNWRLGQFGWQEVNKIATSSRDPVTCNKGPWEGGGDLKIDMYGDQSSPNKVIRVERGWIKTRGSVREYADPCWVLTNWWLLITVVLRPNLDLIASRKKIDEVYVLKQISAQQNLGHKPLQDFSLSGNE